MAKRDWSEGHYLVIVWPDDNPAHMVVTPYGDYLEPVFSDNGDQGPVQVWETFTDPFVLRDGSGRDLNTNMEVVLDIQHDYDLDNEGMVLIYKSLGLRLKYNKSIFSSKNNFLKKNCVRPQLDISEILLFRAALIPKSWEDSFGDTIRKTAQEVSHIY